MTEECWANSQFSIARYYGRVKIDGMVYLIVNKEGKDIFECSREAEKKGREKAIEAGEPADLVRLDFIPFYRKLGRDRFLEVLKKNNTAGERELKECFKTAIKQKKTKNESKK